MINLISGTDSTWSLRAWLCARVAGFEPNVIRIDLTASDYKRQILMYSPAGLVPVLIHEDNVIHDSLAIAEYLNELSDGKLYPQNRSDRALARSLCAEMHSGFPHIRETCPFTQEEVGPLTEPDEMTSSELGRLSEIFASAHLPFMLSAPSAVDAFYAVMARRLTHYGVMLEGKAGEYQRSLDDWSLLNSAFDQGVI